MEIELQLTSERKLMGIEKDLLSVCSNLMTNAIRYSLDAQPIRVTWEDVDENRTRLMVEDKGVGIPQEHLERITERFYRVDIAGSTIRGGTGLGLAIVKHVLRRHDSELQVKSQLGEGSCFFCDFTTIPTPIEGAQSNRSETHG